MLPPALTDFHLHNLLCKYLSLSLSPFFPLVIVFDLGSRKFTILCIWRSQVITAATGANSEIEHEEGIWFHDPETPVDPNLAHLTILGILVPLAVSSFFFFP